MWDGMSMEIAERLSRERRGRLAAEAANWAKSAFPANVRHAIRTAMDGVVGMTELPYGTTLTDEQRLHRGRASGA